VQHVANLGDVREQGIARITKARQRPFSGFSVTTATGVGDDNWNVSEIRTMADSRLNADLHRDADDKKRSDPAVAEGDVQQCSLRGRLRDLVEHRLGWKGVSSRSS